MSEKLTPRVGDRVIYRDDVAGTRIGTVVERFVDRYGDRVTVRMDARPDTDQHLNGNWNTTIDRLEVVDREPVEWPEGWRGDEGFITITGDKYEIEAVRPRPEANAILRPGRLMLSRQLFERIRGPEGDYVAEHIDELPWGD